MKKKEFKAALVVALTATGIDATKIEDHILESACGKMGRDLRRDTGVVNWAPEHVETASGYYINYGKPKVEEEVVEGAEGETATAKKPVAKKKAPAKPMKKAGAKKPVAKKKAAAKKKPTKKK